MMSPGYGRHSLACGPVDMLLDDVALQMASLLPARYARGATGPTAGAPMRVTKPNSASNSPRKAAALGRRRTVMVDEAYRRRLAMMEQPSALARGAGLANEQRSRPLSWHPASHLPPQQRYPPAYAVASSDYHPLPPWDPAAYSGQPSPETTFSPIAVPYHGYEAPQYLYAQTPFAHAASSGGSFNPAHRQQQQQHQHQQQHQQQQQPQYHGQFQGHTASHTTEDPTLYSHLDWNDFAPPEFGNPSTTPPTPENALPAQHPEPTLSATEEILYHPLSLSEPESEGEELIGMGLYDAPEVTKTCASDPGFDYYRDLLMSGFLGDGARKVAPPTGKGLKLEESYIPPPSDDEEDDDQDGEGEDEEEVPSPAQPSQAHVAVPSGYAGSWF